MGRREFIAMSLAAFCLCQPLIGSPIKACRGGREISYSKSSSLSAKSYVQDGLVALWDGIENADWGVHDESATSWVDLIGGKAMPNRSFTSDFAAMTTSRSFIGTHTDPPFRMDTDFTLHTVIVNAPISGFYRTLLGIGSDGAGGLEQGITLTARSSAPYRVVYRPGYSGAIAGEVDTKTTSGEVYSLDIVFSYESKVFSVYVNSEIKGSAEIPEDKWVMDGVNVSIGAYFQSLDATMGHFSIMFYNRALTVEEIGYNYTIDKARFGLP